MTRKPIEIEPGGDGMSVLRAQFSDRYMLRLRIGDSIVSLYFDWEYLAPLTKVDLTPDAPNAPWRVVQEEGFTDRPAWDWEEQPGEDANRKAEHTDSEES